MKLRVPVRLAAAVMVAVTTIALTSCSSSTPTPASSASSASIPQLRVGLSLSFSTLDATKSIYGSWIAVLSLETLMKFGPGGTVEPNLATSVTQPNPVTYVYHLRQGVKFWDGNELTAADVAYSLNYDRAVGSQVALAFTSVKSITATGQYDVTFTLTHPDASWKYTAAEYNSDIFEKKFAQAHAGTFGQPGVLLIGTGPWKIDSFDPTRGATLSANPHWWGGKVPVQKVTFTFFANETSLALAMRSGSIDLTPYVAAPKSFKAASGGTLLTSPSCDINTLSINTQSAPWNDVHLRRAVAYALNRPDIIAAVGGYAAPLYTLIPPQLLRSIASQTQVNSLLSSLPLYQYNLAKARQELAESAYPHGVSAPFLEYNDPISLDEDQVIIAQLQKIGIRLQPKLASLNAWAATESGPIGNRVTTAGGWGCFNPDPSTFYDVLGSQNIKAGSWNVADYTPAAVDSLMTAGQATSDPAQRFALYSQLLQRLQTDLPYIGLYSTEYTVAMSTKFTEPGFSYWPTTAVSGYPGLYLNLKPAA